jgi:hypothetical protein
MALLVLVNGSERSMMTPTLDTVSLSYSLDLVVFDGN